jgi:hypothetical protein
VIDEGSDEDLDNNLQDAFTQGLKKIVNTFQEALPNRSAMEKILIVVAVFANLISYTTGLGASFFHGCGIPTLQEHSTTQISEKILYTVI